MIVTAAEVRASSQSMTASRRRGFTSTLQPQLPARVAHRALAQLAVIAGMSGALSAVPLSPVLQSILLIAVLITGVGSAVSCWLDLPRWAAVASVIGLSVAAVIALATLLARFGMWYPVPSCLVLSFLVASTGLTRLWTLRETGSSAQPIAEIAAAYARKTAAAARAIAGQSRVAGATPYIAAVLLCLALAIWLIALPLLRRDPVGQYGLLVTPGGMLLVTAALVATTGFVVAIVFRRTATAAVAILVVIVIQRVTVTLITEVPIYTWTYKHIGVADYIAKHGSLPPSSVDIYTHWPGFFTAMAWFSSITGLDFVDAAHWFTPLADALIAILMVALALGLGLTLRAALTAAMLAQVVNWVGQDYFSPQAVGLILALATLVVLASSNHFLAAGVVSVPIYTVLVTTHQLTPLWVCITAGVLAVFRQISPRWLSPAYILILVVYGNPRRQYIEEYGSFTDFNPLANANPNKIANYAQTVAHRDSDGRVFTTLVEQGVSLSMWLLAAICLVVIWRRVAAKRLAAGIIAFSPMLLLFGGDYGGEAIIRVYLYSLTGCSVLIAPVLVLSLTLEHRGRRLLAITAVWLALIGFVAAGMQGYYGAWSYLTVTRTQVEYSRSLLATTQAGTQIMTVQPAAGWPERVSGDYVRHALVDKWYDAEPNELQKVLIEGPPTPESLDRLESDANSTGRRLYFVLPRQAWAYNAYRLDFPPGALESLVEQLSERPRWAKAHNDADTLAFIYSPRE